MDLRGARGRRRAPRRWRRAGRSAGSRRSSRGRGRSPGRRGRPCRASDGERQVAHVDAVDRHRARRRVVQPRRRGSRASSCPSRSRRRSRSSSRRATTRSTPSQGRARRRPRTWNATCSKRTSPRTACWPPERDGAASLDVDRQVEVLEDPVEQRARGLDVDADVQQRADREEQPRLQRRERDDGADRDRLGDPPSRSSCPAKSTTSAGMIAKLICTVDMRQRPAIRDCTSRSARLADSAVKRSASSPSGPSSCRAGSPDTDSDSATSELMSARRPCCWEVMPLALVADAAREPDEERQQREAERRPGASRAGPWRRSSPRPS